ncbi:B12-binding domain-containing radical SAM protein, partial [Salmonella enterica subsp. enterica serovar Istanbul]|nr:B12-binding domain-containing radical SAM protein [Salmonella enterica subsp. enterica serovar Istanbul]
AQALRAGHQTKVLNLSGFAWSHVEEIIAKLDADVWGMSCWTANRRGVKLVSEAIKRRHPKAHVVVGGPHAPPLGPELLRHYPHVDTVCIGESDLTFLEIVDRVAKGEPTRGIAGTVYRDGEAIVE